MSKGLLAAFLIAACGSGGKSGDGKDNAAKTAQETKPSQSLVGTVTDGFGGKLEGVTVVAEGAPGTRALTEHQTTGADGTYRLGWDGEAPARTTFSKPGHATVTVDSVSGAVHDVALLRVPEKDGLYLRGENDFVELQVRKLDKAPAGAPPSSYVIAADAFTKIGDQRNRRLRLYRKGSGFVPSHLIPLGDESPMAFDGRSLGAPGARQNTHEIQVEKKHAITGGGELVEYGVNMEASRGARRALVKLVPTPNAKPDCADCRMPENDEAVLLVAE